MDLQRRIAFSLNTGRDHEDIQRLTWSMVENDQIHTYRSKLVRDDSKKTVDRYSRFKGRNSIMFTLNSGLTRYFKDSSGKCLVGTAILGAGTFIFTFQTTGAIYEETSD